jgi:hypothetical protein
MMQYAQIKKGTLVVESSSLAYLCILPIRTYECNDFPRRSGSFCPFRSWHRYGGSIYPVRPTRNLLREKINFTRRPNENIANESLCSHKTTHQRTKCCPSTSLSPLAAFSSASTPCPTRLLRPTRLLSLLYVDTSKETRSRG